MYWCNLRNQFNLAKALGNADICVSVSCLHFKCVGFSDLSAIDEAWWGQRWQDVFWRVSQVRHRTWEETQVVLQKAGH